MWDDPKALNALSLALVIGALVALLTAAVMWAARQPAFAIHRIVVRGELKEVNPAHLEAVAREALRGTFFTLKLDAASAAFGQVPWVRTASVRRLWPDELEVTLIEHQPLARWNQNSSEPMLVDTEGVAFQADYAGDLPAFEGPEGTSIEVAQRYREFAPQLARIGRSLAAIRMSSRRAWELTLDNQLAVELGRAGAADRLQRFVAFYPSTIARVTGRVEAVDMRYGNGFAARVPEFKEHPAARPKA
jgi:cell division protein FtsQ